MQNKSFYKIPKELPRPKFFSQFLKFILSLIIPSTSVFAHININSYKHLIPLGNSKEPTHEYMHTHQNSQNFPYYTLGHYKVINIVFHNAQVIRPRITVHFIFALNHYPTHSHATSKCQQSSK